MLIAPEVAEALAGGRPVVALESTLISHGLPRPRNPEAAGDDVVKCGVRDLAPLVARGGHGATTVASTAHLAALAGIRLFATGGLGGVHREARESWDVSADLAALATTPVAVVCSGVKSILDVPATLEYLETLGVPVVGFRTLRFPGFYLADSGSPLDWAVEGEEEAARVIRALPG